MVIPVIAAGAARVASTAAARGAASTAARAGAQTAGRTATGATRKGLQSEGRNIVRARRDTNLNNSFNRNARPSTSSPTRGRIDSQTKQFVPYDEEEQEDFPQGPTSSQKTKQRIGLLAAGILISIAALFDVVELILDLAGTFIGGVGVVIGFIKDFASFFFFPVAFLFLGVPFWKGRAKKKKMATMILGFLIELIPWVGAFAPATTISVALTVYFTRKEDKGVDPEKSLERDIIRAKRGVAGAKRVVARLRR